MYINTKCRTNEKKKYCKNADQQTYWSKNNSYVVISMWLSKYVYYNRQMKTQTYQYYGQLREQHVLNILNELLIIF